MKPSLLLLSMLTFAIMTTVLFANLSKQYNLSKPPTLALPTAYYYAVAALGYETNQFHCISANVATSFSPEGEWFFTFCSTNSKSKWVTVEFSGKTHVENIMIR